MASLRHPMLKMRLGCRDVGKNIFKVSIPKQKKEYFAIASLLQSKVKSVGENIFKASISKLNQKYNAMAVVGENEIRLEIIFSR